MWLAAGAGNAWEPKEEHWSCIPVRSQANLWLVACCGNRRWWTHAGGTFTTRISFYRPTSDGCSLADLEELNVKDIFLYGPIVLTLPHTFKRAIVFQIWIFASAMMFKYWRKNSNFTFSAEVKVHLFDWQPHDVCDQPIVIPIQRPIKVNRNWVELQVWIKFDFSIPHRRTAKLSEFLKYPLWFQGKLEMTLELLSKQEVEENPAGQGREEPNQNPTLDPPKCVQPLLPYFWFERFLVH